MLANMAPAVRVSGMLAVCIAATPVAAHAQSRDGGRVTPSRGDGGAVSGSDAGSPLVRDEAQGDDPLGVAATELDLPSPDAGNRDREPDTRPGFDVPVQSGEVLDAPSGVQEVDHDVRIHLAHGLARVEVRMRFLNRGRHPAELRYRQAVPTDAAVTALRVCARDRCREGAANRPRTCPSVYHDAVRTEGPASAAPVARVLKRRDARGSALSVRAAPVAPKGGLMTLHLTWVAAPEVHGGVARLTLPPRGSDPRAAPASVKVHADSLLAPSIAGSPAGDRAVHLEPWHRARVVARLPSATGPRVDAFRTRCGDRTCTRARVVAGPRRGPPVDLLLLVDASPSMEGPARNRMATTLASLFAAAPPGSRLRAAAFGARVKPLIEDPIDVTEARAQELAAATMHDLGAATRFDAAWALVQQWALPESTEHRPLIVVVGDGGVSRGNDTHHAFRQAQRAGIEVSAVDLGDDGTRPELRQGTRSTGGIVVQAGAQAELAMDGPSAASLEERIAALFAPVVADQMHVHSSSGRAELGPLRAGEERVWTRVTEDDAAVEVRIGDRHVHAQAPPPALDGALGLYLADQLEVSDAHASWVAVDASDGGTSGSMDGNATTRIERGVRREGTPIAELPARACTAKEDQAEGDEAAKDETADGHRNAMPADASPPEDELGSGLPAQRVLDMLRERVIPVARGCFRRDRRGRLDYSKRAVYHFRLAEREVVEADVRGELGSELRRCLRGALYTLDIPRFTGVVEVTYPIYTERAQRPSESDVELEPDVAHTVEQIVGNIDEPRPDP